MIILFLLFLIQFSIAASCLAVNREQQQQFAEEGWNIASNDIKKKVQDTFLCCGFNATDVKNMNSHPSCENITVRFFKLLKTKQKTVKLKKYYLSYLADVLHIERGSIRLLMLTLPTKIRRSN